MRKMCWGIWLWIAFASGALADTYVRRPSIDVLHYDIAVEFSDNSDSITGTTKLQIQIRGKNESAIRLDFESMTIDRLLAGGTERPFAHRAGRLEFALDRNYARGEIVIVEIQYHGRPKEGLRIGTNKFGSRVCFADNWPDNARHWFPSVDHPSDKATVTFTVAAPAKYSVIANGQMTDTSLENGRRITRWKESAAIPTYCMVIGIAEFESAGRQAGNVPVSWHAYPEDSRLAPEKFRRTPQILAFYQNLIAPYPYEKLANVESSIDLGAMENASAIFYSESYFTGPPVSEEPVIHEIAHQWFGDSITISDWDHLWLSEGFATYFEILFHEHADGPEELRHRMALAASKLSRYAQAEAAPVINPNIPNPRHKLTPVTYEKGAWILHMLRGLLGDRVFFEGIRNFYSLYEGKNASSKDFQTAMERVSGKDLSVFFRQWLYQPGWPHYRFRWHWDRNSRNLKIKLHQEQKTGLFDIPLDIAISVEGRRQTRSIRISGKQQTFSIPLRIRPDSVELDPEGWVLKTVR